MGKLVGWLELAGLAELATWRVWLGQAWLGQLALEKTKENIETQICSAKSQDNLREAYVFNQKCNLNIRKTNILNYKV